MGKRIAGILLLLFMVFSLTGCWNRRELHDLGIVGMMGVENADKELKLTVELIQPQRGGSSKSGGGGEGGEKKSSISLQADGETLFDAIRNATLKSDRKLFFSHMGVIILSEDIARQGLANQMDFMFRDHELRTRIPLLIAVDASPSEIMGIAPGIEDVPSKYIQGVLRSFKSTAKSVDTKAVEFMQLYKGAGKNPVVGVLRKVKKHKVEAKGAEYELVNEGAAVFLKDKLVGFLDGEETRGYNWVVGKVSNTIVESHSPGGQGFTAVEVMQADSKKEVTIKDGVIKATVTIDVTGSLGEEPGAVDEKDPEVLAMTEAGTAQTIKREAERCIAKTQQEYRSDIFGFGQSFHQKFPQEWKNSKADWDELFANSEIEVVVAVKLVRMGKITNPIAK